MWISTGQPKASQQKAQLGTIASRSDDAIGKSKKPQQDLQRDQVVATAGDTVPIVFAKRANNAGGVWVQPALIKQASYGYTGVFLYAISQGEMVSDPEIYTTYSGNRIVGHIPGTTATATHFYASSATMAASPNVCPITGGKIFCDADTAYYLMEFAKPSGWTVYHEPDETNAYTQFRYRTTGTGDTTNTVMRVNGANLTVLEIATGIDRTSDYWDIRSVTDPSTVERIFNGEYSSGVLVGGRAVGTTIGSPLGDWEDPFADLGIDFYEATYGTTEPCVEIWSGGVIDNQVDTGEPADTGQYWGELVERGASYVADPTSFPSSYDFTVYADITFLVVEGNLYDAPSSTDYKISTRQLSTFYAEGVTVDLYSGGLVSGSYATGASNQFVDLAMYLFTLLGKAAGAATADIAMPIDVGNLQNIAAFCTNNGTFFNGIIEQSVNVIDYISTTAQYFLLSFVSANGRYSLQPLLPVTAGNAINTTALTPAATFTEANILPGSFAKEYKDADDRKEINVSLVWREVGQYEVGLQRTTTIRFATTDNDAEVEQFDMTDFCSTQAHAEIFGKYQLALRRHSTHTISFQTPLITTGLIPTDVIRLTRQRKTNLGDNRSETNWYQITKINHSSDGTSTIEAMHFPVDGSDVAEISDEIVNGTFEVI